MQDRWFSSDAVIVKQHAAGLFLRAATQQGFCEPCESRAHRQEKARDWNQTPSQVFLLHSRRSFSKTRFPECVCAPAQSHSHIMWDIFATSQKPPPPIQKQTPFRKS